MIQPFYSCRVRDVVRLVPVVLLVVVVMMIMLIMQMMLIITNIIDHICTLAPCVDHLIFRGGYSRLHSGHQCSNLFPRASDDIHSRSKCSSDRGSAKDSDAQVKNLFYSSESKKDQLLTIDSL